MPLRSENILCFGLVRAMTEMGITHEDLGKIIGMDGTSVIELIAGGELDTDSEKGKLPLYVIRIYQALREKIGKDRENLQHWLRTENKYLKGIPIELMSDEEGLVKVMDYLERCGR